MYDYWIVVVIGLIIWTNLMMFSRKKRREAVKCGLLFTPLVVVDYLMVPIYWKPTTFLKLPVGIEGILVTFFLVSSAYLVYTKFRKFSVKHNGIHLKRALWMIPLTIVVFVSNAIFQINIIYPLLMLFGWIFVLIAKQQPQLFKPSIFAALGFGTLYFLAFNLWQILAPDSGTWWNYAQISGIKIGLVPLEEVVFGILLGLVVGISYDYLTEPKVTA